MNLSIKNVPDVVVERLRARAISNHRSLQGELLHTIKSAAAMDAPRADAAFVLREVRRSGLRSPSDSVAIIREARDTRYGDGG